MGHDQARLAQQKIEGKVLQTVMGVSARKDREATVSHDGNVPDIPDSCPDAAGVCRNDLGINRGKESVTFENLGTHRRKDSLGEDHDRIVMDACPSFMISHSGLSQLGFVVQNRGRGLSKLGSDVVTTMN